MRRRVHVLGRAVAAAVAVAAGVAAQDPLPAAPQAPEYEFEAAYTEEQPVGDHRETRVAGGFRFRWPRMGLLVQGQSALLLVDRDDVDELFERARGGSGLPTRTSAMPRDNRTPDAALLRERMSRFLRASGSREQPPALKDEQLARLPRLFYFEGNVVAIRDGIEIARAERMWISPLEDRIVVEGAELRYVTADAAGGERVITVRGKRLVKEGARWTGRDLSVTSCSAGEPHVELLSGEVEIREGEGEFEILARRNWLRFGGKRVVPLPNASFFTGSQDELPLRSASVGHSSKEGTTVELELGSSWNKTGGAIHEFVTGRDAKEFRGDWNLRAGWIEKRGAPLDGALTYGAKDLYSGRTNGFWMNDEGPNRREIIDNLDGTTIDDVNRNLLRTENRVHLGEGTHLDITAFDSSDAAVWSEWYGGEYRTEELPESSLYLHSREDNRLLTINGRWNLDEYSYGSNRALADRFLEEQPVATYQLLSQKVATTPWDTPVVLDAKSGIGSRRYAYDPLSPLAPGASDEETTRFDQAVELSAPFHAGPVTLRPFARSQLVFYDELAPGITDAADHRSAFSAGIGAGTRFSRTWSWLDADGKEQSVRHVVAPLVTLENEFATTGDPIDYSQFDEIDAMEDRALLRVGVRNLLERREVKDKRVYGEDFVFLDLTQNVFPYKERDNDGEQLGLFEYEFLIRPRAYWIPYETFAYAVEGEQDWETGMRTFNTELRVGKIAGLTWTADYRTDEVVDGAVGLGASAVTMERWQLFGGGQYDLEGDEFRSWTFGMDRLDHDWTIRAVLEYQPYSDEVVFAVEFLPRLFGSGRTRQRDPLRSLRYFSPSTAADY